MKQSIWKYESVDSLKKNLRNTSVVLCGGCFDLIHYGHYVFLRNARSQGDVLVLALESDEYIEKRKKRKPVHTQLQRAEILESMAMVDHVVLLPFFSSDADYAAMVKNIHPAHIAVSEGDPQIEKKRKQAASVGSSVVEVSRLLTDFSTSKILDSTV